MLWQAHHLYFVCVCVCQAVNAVYSAVKSSLYSYFQDWNNKIRHCLVTVFEYITFVRMTFFPLQRPSWPQIIPKPPNSVGHFVVKSTTLSLTFSHFPLLGLLHFGFFVFYSSALLGTILHSISRGSEITHWVFFGTLISSLSDHAALLNQPG